MDLPTDLIREATQNWPAMLDVSDICKILRVNPGTIRKLIRTGRLPATQPEGTAYQVTRHDLLAYLNAASNLNSQNS